MNNVAAEAWHVVKCTVMKQKTVLGLYMSDLYFEILFVSDCFVH